MPSWGGRGAVSVGGDSPRRSVGSFGEEEQQLWRVRAVFLTCLRLSGKKNSLSKTTGLIAVLWHHPGVRGLIHD